MQEPNPPAPDPTDRLEAASRAYEAAFGWIAPPPSFVDPEKLAELLELAVSRGSPITDEQADALDDDDLPDDAKT